MENLRQFLDQKIYLCVNKSPWEYHYGNDNYVVLNENYLKIIENMEFIKLSKKYNLDDFNKLPIIVNDYFSICTSILTEK